MKSIYIINGSGESGKDTFINFIEKHVKETRIIRYSSVDTAKSIAYKYFKWDGKKTEKDRKLLSDLKDLLTNYADIPFKEMKSYVSLFKEFRGNCCLFMHIREPLEIYKMVKEFPEIKTILIKREEKGAIESNHADKNVENYKHYDVIIFNDYGLNSLESTAKEFIEVEGLK